MRWKLKNNKEHTQDQGSKAVAHVDSKFRRKSLVTLILVVLVVSGVVYGGYWMYENGKLGRFSKKQPAVEVEEGPLSIEEIQRQIKEEGEKGPTVDVNTIPRTR